MTPFHFTPLMELHTTINKMTPLNMTGVVLQGYLIKTEYKLYFEYYVPLSPNPDRVVPVLAPGGVGFAERTPVLPRTTW